MQLWLFFTAITIQRGENPRGFFWFNQPGGGMAGVQEEWYLSKTEMIVRDLFPSGDATKAPMI